METLLYIGLGIGIGIAIGWLYARLKTIARIQSDKDTAQGKIIQLERDLGSELATAKANLSSANQMIIDKNKEMESLKNDLKTITNEFTKTNQLLAMANANNEVLNEKLEKQSIIK